MSMSKDAGNLSNPRPSSSEGRLTEIEAKKRQLDQRSPLTESELARLNEEFTVEFTYNSYAIDGNGRTGRLLINLELMKKDYPPIDIKFTDRLRYDNVFEAWHLHHDLSPIQDLFVPYVNERLDTDLSLLP